MSDAKLVIPPPREERPPMHTNIFTAMIGANTALIPLFPLLHPGAMVAGGAIFKGGPQADYGNFYHYNTQNEVVLAAGGNGSTLATGQVYVGADSHGVNSFLKNEKDPAAFATFVVVQVQRESGAQIEGIGMRCEKCSEEIFFKEFDVTPEPDANGVTHLFKSVEALPDIFDEYNADEAKRTCRKCGHVSRTFPHPTWGWEQYTRQHSWSNMARQALVDAARPKAG
jgi:DNA-directed RNA polymerase subunit RPC12/RpoP